MRTDRLISFFLGWIEEDYDNSIFDDIKHKKKRTRLLLNALGRVRKAGIISPAHRIKFLVYFKLYFWYESIINTFNKDVVVSDNYIVYCPKKFNKK